jgi:hypothetical protein
MEGDLVDPVAEPVMRSEHRALNVGVESPADRLRRAGELAPALDIR